jgi:hypothetical protein
MRTCEWTPSKKEKISVIMTVIPKTPCYPWAWGRGRKGTRERDEGEGNEKRETRDRLTRGERERKRWNRHSKVVDTQPKDVIDNIEILILILQEKCLMKSILGVLVHL